MTTIQLRRDTAANWTSRNPILALGEPGVETDTRKIKYGDGTTAWTALSYSAGDANFSGNYNDLANKPSIPSITGLATETYVDNAVSGITAGTSNTGNITISDTTLTSSNGDVKIHFTPSASPAVEFNFASTGDLTLPGAINFPNYVKQTSPGSVLCNANTDTIIYTGTEQYQHTFKLLLKVEGMEIEGQMGWDTQSCEMMVAKSFRNDTVAGSVYGLVYTSANPLATFTTRWNVTSNRVEVLCRPTSSTFGVEVRSFVTEMSTSQ